MNMKKIFLYIVIAAIAVSCKPEIEDFVPSKGDADFSKYVSLGNSITAGYMDGALYKSGQEFAYPNILAKQFKLVGGGEFVQPVVNSEIGVLPGKMILGYKTDCAGVTALSPLLATGTLDASTISYTVNNLGVPGAKSFHLLTPGYGSLNPYYKRFATNLATSKVIDEVAKVNPNFFTLWIGNNDVLTYATSGGAMDSITNPAAYQVYMTNIIAALKANGAKGAVATIPDITSIPFFTTVPYNALVLKDINQVNALNAAYHPVNVVLQSFGLDTLAFRLGANAFVIEDPASPLPAPYKFRQIKSTELITLTVPRDSISCKGWGSQKPIPHRFVLDNSEITAIKNAVSSYNTTITSLANSNGLALVDINKYFSDAKSGIYYDGIKFSSAFITGGLFSLDGVHPSARGQAIIANYFIKAINAKYNAQIPYVNINDYPGLKFP